MQVTNENPLPSRQRLGKALRHCGHGYRIERRQAWIEQLTPSARNFCGDETLLTCTALGTSEPPRRGGGPQCSEDTRPPGRAERGPDLRRGSLGRATRADDGA